MEPKSKPLRDMAFARFNEPMLATFNVVRCIGYAEDERDCYIIVKYPHNTPGRDVIWLSCVGGYIFLDRLKGQDQVLNAGENRDETWDDFTRLDNWLGLNGAPRAKAFIEDYSTRER